MVQTRHFSKLFDLLWPWKWGQGHQNLISFLPSPSDVSVPVWFKSIHTFRRYGADKAFFNTLWPPVTLKIRSRSPKSNQFFAISQWYICASLVKIHQFLQEIWCRQGIFQHSLTSCDLENVDQGHQNLISSLPSPSDISVPVWSKSINFFRRYDADKLFFIILWPPMTLKIRSKSPKSNQSFAISQWYICASLITRGPMALYHSPEHWGYVGKTKLPQQQNNMHNSNKTHHLCRR